MNPEDRVRGEAAGAAHDNATDATAGDTTASPTSPSDQNVATDRILTIPNLLSLLRLVGVGLFLWLLLDVDSPGWALAVLMLSGFSDWADGKLARLLGQSSRLGALLDPAVDRLYMVAIPVGMAVAGTVPWWPVITLLAREVALFATGPLLASRGITALPTLYIGKAATFALMCAFPLILAGSYSGVVASVLHAGGWAFLLWGLGLYLWSLVLYWAQTILVMRAMPRASARDADATPDTQ
ncbi:CDP-alcohol phosphatidyltransferase family protein [Gordonia jinhuaensis]|uniref:CDP-alcohol phosphatidyltransferase family protein n=1 Tax=Gordonia jinhuaensis TaxID=1517702 RepID=UPI001667C752|nr:CDP-alcohol phosphatidyltransferase family protein [Gordonia jinhuaensis]